MLEISSKRLDYRLLSEDDVTQNYVDWLNDPKVNRYLETRHTHQTKKNCLSYVAEMITSPTNYLFGIYLRETGKHIGNVKLDIAYPKHQRAELGLFIGEKNYWGKGLATETIQAITSWGFNNINLEKIDAGCYEENLASLRAFLKSGYQVEGFYRKSILFDERRIGSFRMSALKNEFTI